MGWYELIGRSITWSLVATGAVYALCYVASKVSDFGEYLYNKYLKNEKATPEQLEELKTAIADVRTTIAELKTTIANKV
jgi:hypothetical protein